MAIFKIRKITDPYLPSNSIAINQVFSILRTHFPSVKEEKINPNKSLIYCQETIILDDTLTLGTIIHIESKQHGFTTRLINFWSSISMKDKWSNVIYKNNFIVKEV